MISDVTTKFPTDIDSLHWFQDVHLKDVTAINIYNSLLINKQYSDAAKLMSTGVYNGTTYDVPNTYNAQVLNMLENRLLALEDYTHALPEINIGVDSDTEPTDTDIVFWTC